LNILLKTPTRKQHICFLPIASANAEKIKELFLPSARLQTIKNKKLKIPYYYN
jgi:hypothetical protein